MEFFETEAAGGMAGYAVEKVICSPILSHKFILELVRDFMTERERGNFVLDKADFADVAGSYGEKIQRSIK